jgi:hypothetical protein
MAMEEASENHADILLLPECFITGYDLPMSYEKSISDDDIRIAKICKYAKKYKIGVVLTSFTKGNKQPQNSAFVINKSGDILMKYSKVHTCDFADERDVESGKEFKVCDFEGIQLGIMICYDREYPESARILMLKGAEVILVPNDCGSMQTGDITSDNPDTGTSVSSDYRNEASPLNLIPGTAGIQKDYLLLPYGHETISALRRLTFSIKEPDGSEKDIVVFDEADAGANTPPLIVLEAGSITTLNILYTQSMAAKASVNDWNKGTEHTFQ